VGQVRGLSQTEMKGNELSIEVLFW